MVINDAQRVISRIAADLGGLGKRRIFYRDSGGWFTRLGVEAGEFKGLSPIGARMRLSRKADTSPDQGKESQP